MSSAFHKLEYSINIHLYLEEQLKQEKSKQNKTKKEF